MVPLSPIVEIRWVVAAILVDHQRLRQRAQLQQSMPADFSSTGKAPSITFDQATLSLVSFGQTSIVANLPTTLVQYHPVHGRERAFCGPA